MKRFTRKAVLAGLVAALLVSFGGLRAQGQDDAAQAHLAAARAAVAPPVPDPEHMRTYDSQFKLICLQPKPGARLAPVGPGPAEEKDKLVAVPREQWYTPPVRVFDNLYYIGTQTESTWALSTSAGIILLNTNFPWVTPMLLDELKTVGLDPANIKYVVVVRSHADQAWGINAVKKAVPSARVIMSAVDWDLLAHDNTPADLKPAKDMVAYDGEKVTLGDTTITLYSTPTTTKGNLSVILPLKDGNQRHMGGMMGGDYMRLVQEGVQLFPDMQTMATTYIASATRFKQLEDQAGVDTIVHIHPDVDDTLRKLDAVRARRPGDPNPFVNKDDVDRFMTMEIECAQAQLAWAKGN
jgi:metallo-beta-lactamase class B